MAYSSAMHSSKKCHRSANMSIKKENLSKKEGKETPLPNNSLKNLLKMEHVFLKFTVFIIILHKFLKFDILKILHL